MTGRQSATKDAQE